MSSPTSLLLARVARREQPTIGFGICDPLLPPLLPSSCDGFTSLMVLLAPRHQYCGRVESLHL